MTALQVLARQGYHLPVNAVYEGFAHVTSLTGLQGRWQQIQDAPRTVCDTGHNTGGMQYIVQQLAAQSCDTLRIVMGMVNDKDIGGVLSLLPKNAVYYFTQASVPRALPAQEMQQKAQSYGLSGKAYSSVREAYSEALQECRPNDFIFVGGSTFIVADFLRVIHEDY